MVNYRSSNLTPLRTIWTWSGSALAGAAGLALLHGFREHPAPDSAVRMVLLAAAGLFVLSRLLMLVPPAALGARLKRWWVDYALIAAAGVWWALDRSKEPIILQLAAGYSLVLGTGAAALAAFRALTADADHASARPAGLPLFSAALVMTLVGGTVLALPVCWHGPYPVTWDSTYPGQMRYELGTHWLDTLFTAAAAVTGTGLAVRDVGYEFSRTGQIVILVLMQIGGLAVLAIGTAAGWRLRNLIGWGAIDDDTSPSGLRRAIAFVMIAAIVLEAIGAAILMPMWNAQVDANFAEQGHRLFASVFHAVSAFCNVGLTLTRDSLIPYRSHYAIYASLLPLMVLGALGGPTLYELCRRIVRHQGLGMECVSVHTAFTALASLALIVVVAVAIQVIESIPTWQLRNPRPDTPGRLMVQQAPSPTSVPPASQAAQRAESQRLRTMSPPQRWGASVVLSIAARGGGMRTARLDESSLSPASHAVLLLAMVSGGAVGGTAGGLRLLVFALLIGSLMFRIPPPAQPPVPRLETQRRQVLGIATALAVALPTLIILTTLVLIYRQSGSFLDCLFEATSACCNVGLSTGLTTHLSLDGRVTVILAMLLGRVIPLAILLRGLHIPLASPPEPLAWVPDVPLETSRVS